MNIFTRVRNDATKSIRRQSARVSKTMSGAVKSAGYNLMSVLKKGIKAEAPSGEQWPETSKIVRYQLLEKAEKRYAKRRERIAAGKRVSKRASPKSLSTRGRATALQKMIKAAGYKTWVNKYPEGDAIKSTKVHTGFLSKSASRWAAYHMTGPHTQPVTPKMRRLFFAAGLILKAANIKIPRRRTTEAVYEKNINIYADFVRRRVTAAIQGIDPKSVNVQWR